jgi:hypothetical protein
MQDERPIQAVLKKNNDLTKTGRICKVVEGMADALNDCLKRESKELS